MAPVSATTPPDNMCPLMRTLLTHNDTDAVILDFNLFARDQLLEYATVSFDNEDWLALDNEDEAFINQTVRLLLHVIIDENRVTYHSAIIQDIEPHDNPLYYVTNDVLDKIRKKVNETSFEILQSAGKNPQRGFVQEHSTLEELFLNYIGCLYYWETSHWLLELPISD
jgi:hypothetical protein